MACIVHTKSMRAAVRPRMKEDRRFGLAFIFLYTLNHAYALVAPSSSPTIFSSYRPSDNYLIDCGSSIDTKLDNGRIFKSDYQSNSYLSTNEDIKVSMDSIPKSIFSPMNALYKTARVFKEPSTYKFFISKPGKHLVRLYFYPLHHPRYDLKTAVFTVHTEKFVLLHDFSVADGSKVVLKEYLVNFTRRFSLVFKPKHGSYAFVNAIEVAAVPDEILSDSASSLPQGGTVNGLLNHALEVKYRLNMGGPVLTPKSDTLSRTWEPDELYNVFPQGAQAVRGSYMIKYWLANYNARMKTFGKTFWSERQIILQVVIDIKDSKF